jgi:hypothetical protein
MKLLSILFCALFLTLATLPSRAQCVIPAPTSSPTYPPTLIDELTGQPLSSTATKCIVLIHGWNPSGAVNCYGGEFSSLLTNLKIKLAGTGWSIVAYDWHQDASTGYIGDSVPTSFPQFLFAHANQAAANAQLHGNHLATMLDNAAPDLREVQFIAHSAGTHAAKEAMIQMLQLNPYVIVQTTFLDPYIPCPADSLGNFSDYAMDQLQFTTGNNRIQRLENYYANDDPTHGWNAFPSGSWTGPTLNTQETFNWRTSPTLIDINQEIDWGNILVNPVLTGSVFYLANYDWHAGPIRFYADTVDASISGHTPSSSLPTGSPYDYRNIGWNRSLYAWESFLPKITSQPADKTVQSGGSVTLTIAANQADNIDWYVFTGNWIGSGQTLTLNNFTAANPRLYVARVSNSYGQLYSRPALVTVGSASAPTITSVWPTSIPTSSAQQPIKIYGTGFTSGSTLLFNGVTVSDPARLTVVSANEIDYNVIVLSAGSWSVQVVNGSLPSNQGSFTVYTPAANTGSLVVNLSPTGATTAGAQWLLNGSYHNSGDVVASLTPGQYTVSFKSVSGYTTPASFTVNIVANQQTTTNATYTVVAPSAYTLTLNYDGVTGYIVNQPFGTGSGNIYTAGAVVQLTANAYFGYHFVSWGGDASGTANPTTITMNGNKTVSANFAAGDPNLGTVIVTIQPPEAAAAGVTWGFNDNDFRASGTSYSYYPETLWVELHNTNGWTGVGGWVTFTAGQTSNYIFAASSTNGTIIGNDPRTYYTLAGAAGNSGSTDGTNSSARFSQPKNLAMDNAGNIFVVDGSIIRKVTAAGMVTTVAGTAGVSGSADGQGTNASFNNPIGIAIDQSNNLYVADFMNSTIRKITPGGMVSTFAGLAGNNGSVDANGASARFYFPIGVAVAPNGNIYVSDSVNETIRAITPNGDVTTLAGLARGYGYADGTGNTARFHNPMGMAADASNNVYVADEVNEVVRKVTPAGVVTTLAGFPGSSGAADGTGNAARFYSLNSVAVDSNGNVYVADTSNQAIRKITPNGVVTTLAGQSGNPGSADGVGSVVRFHQPAGVAVNSSGNLFVTDMANYTIRVTQPLSSKVNQSIAFPTIPIHSAGDAPFTITATASSGLPVYFNVISGPAVSSNNVVTLLGGGTVTVVAWQPGDANYNPAPAVQQSFTVTKVPQTITFGALSQQKVGDAPFPLLATSDSGLLVSFSASGPAILSGNILTLTGWGTVNVTASQPGNNSYAAATPAVQSFTVAPPDNTLVGLGFQNHSFQMAFYGMAGSNYTIQASSNLLNWQPFTNFIITDSPYNFTDPTATNFNKRFYRATLP